MLRLRPIVKKLNCVICEIVFFSQSILQPCSCGCLSKLHRCDGQVWQFFLDMRRDVQEIFRGTPHDKQVMMFSATLSKETREICKKFMQDVNINFHYNNSKPSFPSSCHVPPIFGSDKTLVGSLAMVHVTSWYSPSSSNQMTGRWDT